MNEESNFGSLPPKDKQIVIDGANVAWYFTDSSYFCTKVSSTLAEPLVSPKTNPYCWQ